MLHVTQADGVCVTQAARDVAYLAWIPGMSISVPLRSSLPLRLRARDKARAGHLSKITDPSGIQIAAGIADMAVTVGIPLSVPVLESATSSSAPLVVITTLVSTGDPIGSALGSLAHVPGILSALRPCRRYHALQMLQHVWALGE